MPPARSRQWGGFDLDQTVPALARFDQSANHACPQITSIAALRLARPAAPEAANATINAIKAN
jgi:hypothetical protein